MKLINYLLFHGSLSLFFFYSPALPEVREFYVSPEGNDQHAGSKDQPFATLEKSRAVALQSLAGQPGDLTIWLQPGRHQVTSPVVFESGSFQIAPVSCI